MLITQVHRLHAMASRGLSRLARRIRLYVGHPMQPEHRSHSGPASGLELPQAGGLFDPAKHLLNPLPGVDRLSVALVS